jgi:hypothetical protein
MSSSSQDHHSITTAPSRARAKSFLPPDESPPKIKIIDLRKNVRGNLVGLLNIGQSLLQNFLDYIVTVDSGGDFSFGNEKLLSVLTTARHLC